MEDTLYNTVVVGDFLAGTAPGKTEIIDSVSGKDSVVKILNKTVITP